MTQAPDIAAALRLRRNGREWRGACPSCGYATGFVLAQHVRRLGLRLTAKKALNAVHGLDQTLAVFRGDSFQHLRYLLGGAGVKGVEDIPALLG